MSPCPWCGSRSTRQLTNPHPRRSVLSDLRIVERPLDKDGCLACGLVWRAGVERPEDVYTSSYRLYDHPPRLPREQARQALYAQWLAAILGAPPRSILDVGCGNGSLLLSLRARWPEARLLGMDLSAESVAHARAAGVDASAGAVSEAAGAEIEVAVAVNVIEHVADPVAFLQSVAATVRPGGDLLVVCPDGAAPSVELLFLDHLWSFTPNHLSALARDAGLLPVTVTCAPDALGPFQLLRATKPHGSAAELSRYPVARENGLTAAKDAYLRRWGTLDTLLLERAAGSPRLTCFGIGEAAGLLRAYTPETWSRVRVCTADEPEESAFGGVPVRPWDVQLSDAPVLLGTHPRTQGALAARLESAGRHVVRWDDHISR